MNAIAIVTHRTEPLKKLSRNSLTLDAISKALVLFSGSILFFSISGKLADRALKTVIQQGRRQGQTAGVPLGTLRICSKSRTQIGKGSV